MSNYKCSYGKNCECKTDEEKSTCDLAFETKTKMSKIKITIEELEKEIKQAFIHGQGNKEMMEVGLERDETEDYVNSIMRKLLNQNNEE